MNAVAQIAALAGATIYIAAVHWKVSSSIGPGPAGFST